MSLTIPQQRYVLSTFARGFANAVPREIAYGIDGVSPVQIASAGTDFFRSRQPFEPSRIVWREWRGRRIPFLFDGDGGELLKVEGGKALIGVDLLASAFFFLSGWQEYASTERDAHGRFPYAASLQARLDLIERPVVDEYFDILRSAIEAACGVTLRRRTWNGRESATALTHDIDKCETGWLEDAAHCARRGEWLRALSVLARRARGSDWFNMDAIVALESSLGVKSSFFFIPRRGRHGGIRNADYDVTEARYRRVIERITAAGSEAGLHGSAGTHDDAGALARDIARLSVPPRGGRFHFLCYDAAKTPRILEDAGLSYDSTLGFADRFGFRNGTCLPFFLYDIPGDRETRVLEIPLTVMDTTLQHRAFMNLPQEEVPARLKKLAEEIDRFGGCMTLLWHNNYFTGVKYGGWSEVFQRIVEDRLAAGSWVTSAAEIAREMTGSEAGS